VIFSPKLTNILQNAALQLSKMALDDRTPIIVSLELLSGAMDDKKGNVIAVNTMYSSVRDLELYNLINHILSINLEKNTELISKLNLVIGNNRCGGTWFVSGILASPYSKLSDNADYIKRQKICVGSTEYEELVARIEIGDALIFGEEGRDRQRSDYK